MSSRIPKQEIVKDSIIQKPFITQNNNNNISFSFISLEKTEYFNLDGTCQNWASDLFEMLKNASNFTRTDLIQGKLRTYRVHNHEKAKPPNPLPDGVALKDLYQIRLSQSKGGIHGVFYENIFYVIWLDPLHNMYPDKRFGGLRKVKQGFTCCKDRDECIASLKEKIEQLENDLSFWENEFKNI